MHKHPYPSDTARRQARTRSMTLKEVICLCRFGRGMAEASHPEATSLSLGVSDLCLVAFVSASSYRTFPQTKEAISELQGGMRHRGGGRGNAAPRLSGVVSLRGLASAEGGYHCRKGSWHRRGRGVTTGRSQRSHSMSRRELRASPITPFYLESSGALAVGQEQAYADDSTSFT